VNIINKEENILNHTFNNTANLIDTTKITANNEITEKSFSILENNRDDTKSHESDNKDVTYSHLQVNLQSVENDGRYNLNVISSNGSSTVHREHLLEIASETTKMLKDDIDHNEPNSDLNLKCSNQFLSTSLEEQKQVVNDLYMQLGHYVSILYFIVIYIYYLMLLLYAKIK